jgi:transcriptional regulator with XRE-family HTH domain
VNLAAAMAVLTAERKRLGLRQIDLTALTGTCQQEISRHEQGKFVTYRAVERYADALGFDVELSLVRREPVARPNTQEENIAFRKAWDARVDAGKARDEPEPGG